MTNLIEIEVDLYAILCGGDVDYEVDHATKSLLEESRIDNAKKEKEINKIKNKIKNLNESLAKWEAKIYKPNSRTLECRYEERAPISIGKVNEIKKARRIANIKSDIERLHNELYEKFQIVL